MASGGNNNSLDSMLFTEDIPATKMEFSFERLHENHCLGKVLSFLTDIQDICSASDTCWLFREYLEEKRTKAIAVFKGLKVLLMRHHRYLERKDLLNIRRVSKYLQLITDFWWPDAHLLHLDNFHDFTATSLKVQVVAMASNNEASADRAAACLVSPSMGRVLIYAEREHIPDVFNFRKKVLRFLDEHGKGIWCFAFTKLETLHPTPIVEQYEHLRQMLMRMPNLRGLKICFIMTRSAQDSELEYFQSVLSNAVMNSPLPCLNQLVKLGFDERNPWRLPVTSDAFIFKYNVPLMLELMKKAPNVKSLDYKGVITQPVGDAMEKLDQVELFTGNEIYRSIGGNVHLLTRVQWPLRKLELKTGRLYDFDKIVSILNRFQSSLEELRLLNPTKKNGVPRSTLYLPKLRKMDLVIDRRDSFRLDDLVTLKALEEMTITLVEDGEVAWFEAPDPNETIPFLGFGPLQELMIHFGNFPKLRNLDLFIREHGQAENQAHHAANYRNTNGFAMGNIQPYLFRRSFRAFCKTENCPMSSFIMFSS